MCQKFTRFKIVIEKLVGGRLKAGFLPVGPWGEKVTWNAQKEIAIVQDEQMFFFFSPQ